MPIGIIIFLLVLLFLFVVYLVLISPKRSKMLAPFTAARYAHRGLHNETRAENSMSAFRAAVEAGYGIELDVQLSKDGVVTVFHDYSLLRMTGVDKKLNELDFSQLKTLSLDNTEEKIPSLKEVLSLIDGKVPLLVELKGETTDTSLCKKTAELLKEYYGEYCIESFFVFHYFIS